MYKVFGYTDDCRDFSVKFDSFVEAVKAYREHYNTNVLFISRIKRPGEKEDGHMPHVKPW